MISQSMIIDFGRRWLIWRQRLCTMLSICLLLVVFIHILDQIDYNLWISLINWKDDYLPLPTFIRIIYYRLLAITSSIWLNYWVLNWFWWRSFCGVFTGCCCLCWSSCWGSPGIGSVSSCRYFTSRWQDCTQWRWTGHRGPPLRPALCCLSFDRTWNPFPYWPRWPREQSCHSCSSDQCRQLPCAYLPFWRQSATVACLPCLCFHLSKLIGGS